jgi:hypothetical protein
MSVLPPHLLFGSLPAPLARDLPPDIREPFERELRARFDTLATQWKKQSACLSNETHAAMLPSYQQIIGLGPAAVPLILEELQREPALWFWALEAITGEDPIPPDAGGRFEVMTQAWLNWGRAHGLLA